VSSAHRPGEQAASRAAEQAWREAASFAELRALGARFVAGELDFFPGWGAPATVACPEP
jgi:hypothetical protein